MNSLKNTLRGLLRKWDRDIFQVSALEFTHSIMRKQKLLQEQKIDLVLDVGANEGQFGTFLRHHVGYAGDIVSYEPLTSAFGILTKRADGDERWKPINLALGAEPGNAAIHIAGNSQSSSLLGMLDQHRESAPSAVYVGTETIRVSTLDLEGPALGIANHNVYLKIDTQGFERSVLDGAAASLAHIGTIELEMSFVPLYEGQTLFAELNQHLRSLGYVMISIEPMFCDPKSGEILQADVVFKRRSPV